MNGKNFLTSIYNDVSGFIKSTVANTWTAIQTFNAEVIFNKAVTFTKEVVTIATGAVTPESSYISILNQDGDPTDDLNTINNTNYGTGSILVCESNNNGQDPTLKDAVDNLELNSDFTLTNRGDKITLIARSSSTWNETSRSDNI